MSASLAEVILAHINVENRDIFTAIPATILDVGKLNKNLLTVQPALDVVESDGVTFSIPPIPDVPIQWPAGGGAVMTFPLAVGDDVLLIFSMRSIGEFQLSNSGNVQPFLKRHHAIEDCYVIPSIFRNPNQPSPNTDDVEIKYNEGSFKIAKDGTVKFITTSTFSVTNDMFELIAELISTLTEISNTTVNTVFGVSPLNNKVAIQALIANLETFEET